MMRPYRWLTVRTEDRDAPQLVRERVRCGKPSCRCTRGVKHGPYWYLRYEEWDQAAGVVRYRREYVPKCKLARVRLDQAQSRGERAHTVLSAPRPASHSALCRFYAVAWRLQ
jgi:hypothetical protein